MSQFSKNLLEELNYKLGVAHHQNSEPILYCTTAIKILLVELQNLKNYYCKHQFANHHEEIHFFKIIKPQFVSKLIYYKEILNINISKPHLQTKSLRKFYNSELTKVNIFYNQNIDFLRYFRSGSQYLDDKYFVRIQDDFQIEFESVYIQQDLRFTTLQDYKVAQIMAFDLVQLYLENELCNLRPSQKINPISSSPPITLQWTASKVALVELIYALHSYGVFNKSSVSLKEVAEFFEKTLNVDLGQFHRTFLEIRMRKSERTKFLSSLQTSVLQRMENADE